MIKKLLTLLILVSLPVLGFTQTSALGMPSPSDQSVILLSYVFGVVNGVLHGTGSQIMGQMFAQFNSAMLVLCGVVIMYTTILGILNTAQDGEFLGKKYSSFFIPLRTALGIILIAPTSTGYSWIQVLVIWIVLQGVTAANAVWTTAINYLLNGGTIITQSQNTSTSPAAAKARTLVQSLIPAVTCLQLTQRAIDETVYSSQGAITPPTQSALQSVMFSVTSTTGNTVSMPNYTAEGDKNWQFLNGLCGSVQDQTSFTNPSQTNEVLAFNQVMLDLAAATPSLTSSCNASCYDKTNNSIACPGGTTIPNDGALCTNGEADCYPNGLVQTPPNVNPYGISNPATTPIMSWCNNTDASQAINWSAYSNLHDVVNMATLDYVGLTYVNQHSSVDTTTLTKAKNAGWIGAGAYYFALLQANAGAAQSGTSTGQPFTFNPPSSSFAISKSDLNNKFQYAPISIQNNEDRFITWLLPFFSDPQNGLMNDFTGGQAAAANYGYTQAGGSVMFGPTNNVCNNTSKSFKDVKDWGNDILCNVLFPGLRGMISALQTLQTAQQTSANPVITMMQFGSSMMDTALGVWLNLVLLFTSLAFVAAAIPSVTFSDVFTTLGVVIGPLLSAILLPMFIAGAMLCFYLPAIPFMIFTFGAIGWIVGVIEAMIAAPVVAFGIMHPEGGSDLFGRGEQALMLMLNLFLRPPLMIFGLIAGIMISYVGVWMINDGWSFVVSAINPAEGFTWAGIPLGSVVGFVAIPLVYLVMMMQVINRSFSLIHLFPDRITRWLSNGIQESLGSEFSGAERDVRAGVSKGVDAMGGIGKAVSGAEVSAAKIRSDENKEERRQKGKGSGGGGSGNTFS